MPVKTPLILDRFAHELRSHPNKVHADYVLRGIKEGFRLGFHSSAPLRSAKRNKRSAMANPTVIDTYLANELKLGRLAGPFPQPPIEGLHISSFGVIPKRGQPGKWRLIVDLSAPVGASVNDGIDPESYSLQYVKVADIIRMVSSLGTGALMAKFDVEAAYRNIPVHPGDRNLLGMKWKGQYYVDLVLPFGLRSAPYIFDSVASLVEWIIKNNYHVDNIVHYLDDFILAGPPNSTNCLSAMNTSMSICTGLGLPLHPTKCVGPSTVLTVLGIELDSTRQSACLPQDKLTELQRLIRSWRSKKWCMRLDLESLIGHLHHAAKVVWPGRTFIRRMLDVLCCFRDRTHPIRLNVEFKKDLQWWDRFLGQWNGVSFWLFPGVPTITDVHVSTDASGTIGYGAIYGNKWFAGAWDPQQLCHSIAYKELFPIVVAACVWGHEWERGHVVFSSDNEAVVGALNSRTSRAPPIMGLLRELLYASATCDFSFSSQHIPGHNNQVADALSRFHWQEFQFLAPEAAPEPTPIPPHLTDALTRAL